MATWKIEEPQKLTFDTVTRLRVRAVAGSVDVVGSDDRPTLEVSELDGPPLLVRHHDGVLEIEYERPRWPGPLGWLLGPRRRWSVISLAVPRDCGVDLGAVSSGVMVSGLRAPLVARTVSGEITLAGCSGQVEAQTVSGAVQAHGVAGDLWAHTVSGDLTVRVPQQSDLQVQLQSTSGQVASAFDELHREGRPAQRSISGRLGAGTGRLRASTTSGHVALLRRELEAEAGEPR
jgi:hypothetical protein